MSSPSPEPDRAHTNGPPVVLVVGEALIDIVHHPDGTVVEHVGGSPTNVALGLGRLGVPVRLRTALARDARGERIAAHLTGSGVLVDPGSWALPRTSTAVAHIGGDGAAAYDFDLDWQLPEPLALAGERVVHVGSIAAFLEPGASTIEDFLSCVAGRVRVTFDPNIRPALVGDRSTAVATVERLVRVSDVVKLSDEDAAWLFPGMPVGEVADRILGLGAKIVAVTLGGQGAVLATQANTVTVAAPAVTVVDTVGAGDTFMAALIDALLPHPDLNLDDDALRGVGAYAVAAAAITVQRAGADLPHRHQLP